MTALLNGTPANVVGILGVTFVLVALGLGLMALFLGSGRARKIGIALGSFGIVGLIGTIMMNITSTTSLFGIIDWSQIPLANSAMMIGAALGGGGLAIGLFVLMMSHGR